MVIVDEFDRPPGRGAQVARRHSPGHRGARKACKVTVATGQAARITVQDLFLRYRFLAGMTGTADQHRPREIRKIYKRPVLQDSHQPRQPAQALPDRVFGTGEQKWEAIVEEVKRNARTRPPGAHRHAVDRQERSSFGRCSRGEAIPHQVLNARPHCRRGRNRGRAGQSGKVTVATNMAGRGTDIKLGARRRRRAAGCTSFAPNCTTRPASTAS